MKVRGRGFQAREAQLFPRLAQMDSSWARDGILSALAFVLPSSFKVDAERVTLFWTIPSRCLISVAKLELGRQSELSEEICVVVGAERSR